MKIEVAYGYDKLTDGHTTYYYIYEVTNGRIKIVYICKKNKSSNSFFFLVVFILFCLSLQVLIYILINNITGYIVLSGSKENTIF